ncbi:hypothetical protein [Brasilonema sp. UFV-L1]|uniref:hypothetical protein n=1 Tax=Brasilonema sp. UFV-L1 TaxID=2234130 RepID=UPI00145F4EE3|nr:hypothetical protein [Brasilonema sp. UFV-L1]NMG10362.1 hypothetical protein [Brasilonema sp. UFV-L1]
MKRPKAADLYHGRRVYYGGTVYQVEACNGETVHLVVPGQQSTMLYQPYPGNYTNFSRWEVPVNSPLLFVEDEQGPQLHTSSTHQWQSGNIIRVNFPSSRFHNLKGVVTDSYVACGKTWVQATFDDLSLEFSDDNVELLSSSIQEAA